MGSRSTVEPDLLRGVQVLVVDDDGEARMLFESVLEYFGAQVVSADSARAARDVPVIALTGYSAAHAAEDALAAGFQAYLRKPVEPRGALPRHRPCPAACRVLLIHSPRISPCLPC